jgi:tetratricopeptide (TPR) repeat protein
VLAAVAIAGAAATFILRRGARTPDGTWEEIQQAVSSRRWGRARPQLQRWIAVHPDRGEPRLLLAQVELGLRHRDRAVELLQSIPQEDSNWSRAQMALGRLAVSERRAADAERIFRVVADRDGRAIEPRRSLLYLLGMEQRAAEARTILWQIYRISDDPRVLVDLVLELLLDRQDVRGLAPELELLVAQTPDDPLLRRAWGMALLFQGRPRQALPHLEAAASALRNDPFGRYALAECLIQLGRLVDLAKILGEPPEEAVDAAQWWVFRGQIALAAGHPHDAFLSYERAVALNPENREAHFRLGQMLKRQGRGEPAGVHIARASEIEERLNAVRREHQKVRRAGLPSDPGLFERLGGLCARAGLTAEARAWFEQAGKLDPAGGAARALAALPQSAAESPPLALPNPLPESTPGAAVAGSQPAGFSLTAAIEPARAIPPAPFEEGTEGAGITYRYESGASDRRLFIADTMGGGVGLLDFDGDGWLDIYLVNGCALPYDVKDPPRPNRLLRNQRDGTFRDVTGAAGVAGKGYGMGCTAGDYDNDGDLDLFVTGLRGTILYRNRGDGTFEDVTTTAGVFSDRWTTAAGFGDLDGDGDLDLVVITYVDVALDDDRPCRDHAGQPIHCTPGYYPAQPDLLYRNNGDGTFTEVSQEAGFVGPEGRGLGLAIADFEGDGRLDLFVANDATPSFLFRNRGDLRFEEAGTEAGVATNGAGRATAAMGVVADDLDGDGRIDLFVTNLVNESSTFFRNLGGGLFADATLGAGLDAPSRPKTGFGTAALDADADGRLDLFVANGHVDDRPWANSPMAQTALFFWGRNRGRFEVAAQTGSAYFARPVVGRGVAAGDLNNDGRVDLVVIHRDAPASLLWNGARTGHWLGILLRGTVSGKTPIGTQVTFRIGDRSLVRWLTSGTGYLSAHDPRLWFGLEGASSVDRIEIKWPSGRIQSWAGVAADRIVEVEEGRDSLRTAAGERRAKPQGSP